MGIIKKIVHILSIITYVLIAIYAVVCIPMVLGYNPIVVLSGSMEPTYKTGSVIYYKKTSLEDLKENDVITFVSRKGELVSHRIVGIDNDQFETKGDANEVKDVSKVSYENIKGKVARFSIPYVGYYIRNVNDNLTIIVLTLVIILVSEFLLSNIETFDINKKNGRSEKNEENQK